MYISEGMDKQIVVYTYNGILLILKVEWSANIGYNIDELENIMLSGKKKPDKSPHIVWLHLYKMSRIGKSIKTESRLVFARC